MDIDQWSAHWVWCQSCRHHTSHCMVHNGSPQAPYIRMSLRKKTSIGYWSIKWSSSINLNGSIDLCSKFVFVDTIVGETPMWIKSQEILQIDSFWYVIAIISKDGDIEEDVKHTIRVGRLKWRLSSRVSCDWRMLTRLNGEFHTATTKPATTNGAECWPMIKQHMHKMSATEMRVLR